MDDNPGASSNEGLLTNALTHATVPLKNVDADGEPDRKRRRVAKAEESTLETLPSALETLPSALEALPSALEALPSALEALPSALEALPVDIILEILSYLRPIELLHLARTSRRFRSTLMSKTSSSIWESSRESLDTQVPERPEDQSEPQWASLLFDLACPMCSSLDSTEVEWGLRVRGCNRCLESILIFGSEVSREFPGIRDIDEILDLLPFTYQSKWTGGSLLGSIPRRAFRQYHRPAIQPMIDHYHSLKESASIAGDAEEAFENFVAERMQYVAAILDAEKELKRWEVEDRRLREKRAQEEKQKWQNVYREELIAMGHDLNDARRAAEETSPDVRLDDGWERNQEFYKKAASRIKRQRTLRDRLPIFHTLCQIFLAEPKRSPPIRGLWPSSRDLLDADPQIQVLLETGRTGTYQAELKEILPSVLVGWWRTRKEVLVDKILNFGSPESAADGLGGPQPRPDQATPPKRAPIPPFASRYARASGPSRLAILGLAKSVFLCSCRCPLEYCPIYWDQSLVNHRCIRERHPVRSLHAMDFDGVKFDPLASKQVDAVCEALGLDSNRVMFKELDEIDARFRCLSCNSGEIFNWRVGIKHRHNENDAPKQLSPTFAKVSDKEATHVRAFELENPDKGCPLGRIRSRVHDKAFHTTNELLAFLKKKGIVKERETKMTHVNYLIDPCVPPKPVLEAKVFPR